MFSSCLERTSEVAMSWQDRAMERHRSAVSLDTLSGSIHQHYLATRRVVCLPCSFGDACPLDIYMVRAVACIRLSRVTLLEGRPVAGARALVACDS